MIKYICLLVAILLCNCSKRTTDTEGVIRVSVLRGPSAIAFAHWMQHPPTLNGKKFVVKIIDTPVQMQANLIKEDVDIAVLPMANAANLHNKGIHYLLAGCPIWGTLYMVENKDIEPNDNSLYIFGVGANPDILTRYYLKQKGLSYSLNYSFSTAEEVMQALYIGKAQRAVLSEPFLSMALQRDSLLHIVADLNPLEDNISGFAQTAILFVPSLEDYRNSLDSLLDISCRFANEKPKEAIRILETKKVFPEKMLTAKCIERCKIKYVPISDSRKNVLRFLQLLYDYEPKAIGGKLPGKDFTSSFER
ncbi:MAG: ABC transporter substrate-binding protein [Tannerellaceae bacterium]|jgi:NitT/TauT family transport system substrate-binding protein|nr:ABC transporter substrate-binding protein [Tannerellaceae bacterium]